jgi:hypothetical protein
MLNYLAMALFAIGTAVAAISAAKPAGEEIWWLFAIGAVIIIGGIIVQRIAAKEAAAKIKSVGAGLSLGQVTELITNLPGKCREILARFDDSSESPESLLAKVDVLSEEDVYNLVENRAVLAQSLGAGVYPLIFGEFAEGERLFNRTWSALCDKHIEEARVSLTAATEFFEKVSAEITNISGQKP